MPVTIKDQDGNTFKVVTEEEVQDRLDTAAEQASYGNSLSRAHDRSSKLHRKMCKLKKRLKTAMERADTLMGLAILGWILWGVTAIGLIFVLFH